MDNKLTKLEELSIVYKIANAFDSCLDGHEYGKALEYIPDFYHKYIEDICYEYCGHSTIDAMNELVNEILDK